MKDRIVPAKDRIHPIVALFAAANGSGIRLVGRGMAWTAMERATIAW
jgi:hypothetical protein